MLSSSQYAMVKLSKTSSTQKLFDYDCVTLYVYLGVIHNSDPSLLTQWLKLVGDYIALLNSYQVTINDRAACPKFGHPLLILDF